MLAKIEGLCVQGSRWDYTQLAKDLCDLHAPETLTALLSKRVREDSQLSAPREVQELRLQSLHDECIACCVAWLKAEHAEYSTASFVVTGTNLSATTLTRVFLNALSTADRREQTTHRILAAAGLEVTACNKPGTAMAPSHCISSGSWSWVF